MNNYGKLYEENCYLRSEQAKLVKQITQLTNNWNELEEWVKSEKERFREIAINQGLFIDKELSMRIDTRIKLIDSFLDKMKEIKGRKDVSNNN